MSSGVIHSPRPYQLRARDAVLSSRRCVAKMPAGSGKTFTAAMALDRWCSFRRSMMGRAPRVAWVANTLEQCEQARTALAMFDLPEVTVACYASELDLSPFDMVVLDECHHVGAPTIRQMVAGCKGWMWGFSATPDREKEVVSSTQELIGPIAIEVHRSELLEAGQLSKARVVFHRANRPKELEVIINAEAKALYAERARKFGRAPGWDDREQWSRCVWHVAQKFGVFDNEPRNRRIVEIANYHAADSTLIIVGKIEQGQLLSDGIPASTVVFSRMPKKKRAAALAAFKDGSLRCCIATSLADEGLDVPRANVMILATASRSSAKVEQRTGRVLRAFGGKTHGLIHDFRDEQHYYLHAQSRKREQLYRGLGYDVTDAEQEELWRVI